MLLPNFLVIGAAKAGTTSLYAYLKQHPQIYMSPVKETNFFAFEGKEPNFIGVKLNENSQIYQARFKTDIASYCKQFQKVSEEIAIGETCPSYLYIPQAAERIKNYIPETKLIAILRDPIERAYSNFLHHLRYQAEDSEDFRKAIEKENWRIENNWWWGFHYIRVGFYFEQIKRYFELFAANQIRVYLYEDLKANPVRVMQDIYDFLNVDNTFIPNVSKKHNVTKIPRNRNLHQLLTKSNLITSNLQRFCSAREIERIATNLPIISNLYFFKPQLLPEIRQELIEVYKDDIWQLEKLINRDLTKWLK
jgi:hypothetical protein